MATIQSVAIAIPKTHSYLEEATTEFPMMNAAYTPAYGPASVLEIRRLPIPTPGPREVLVRVEASAITAGDLRVRAGDFGVASLFGRLLLGVFGPRRPVQGTMFSGVVAAVGEDVERFAVGDAVFGSARGGAWAEYLLVPEQSALAVRPAHVTASEAAAVPYGAGTAWVFLHELAKVQPGERVLILGGSGGVGRFAIQIARHLGAHVTAVGSRRTLGLMRNLGADEVLDYKEADFTLLGAVWDVILDTADASSFPHSRAVLSERGRYVTLYVGLGILFWSAWTRWRSGPRALFTVAAGTPERTRVLADLLDQEVIRPVVDGTYALAGVSAAHRRAEAGAHGDVVVLPIAGAGTILA